MRHAVFVAPFADLCDPRAVADLAAEAEEAGWDAVFLWDHLLRPAEETEVIGDAWISLAAAATATRRVRLGIMVTPVTRRRPARLAREVVAVDHLSGGRLVVGLGLGVDRGGELSRFGEIVDPVVRGRRLDEGAELLVRLWSGERVDHRGEHFVADGVRFLPRPVQRPHPPLWFAARAGALRPVRRAARLGTGLHAIEVDARMLERMLDEVVAVRGSLDGFDVACPVAPGTDGAEWRSSPVTWAMHSFGPTTPLAEIRAVVAAGPPR